MKFLIGVDIGGTNTRIALVDRKGRIRGRAVFSTARFKGRKALVSELIKRIKFLMEAGGLRRREITGIGIGVPGAVDSTNGIVHYLTNIHGWRGVPLKRTLERALRIPVFIDNDANVMALGEFYHGAGRGARNIVCVTLGTGVGGGLILEGRLYRGSSLAAGEIGHMPLNTDGPRCECGSRACVEAYVGNNRIVRRVVQRIKEGERTVITKLAKGHLSAITPETIDRAFALGDNFAGRVWKEAGTSLGICLAGVVNLLNPDRIVIGGGIAKAGRPLFDAVRSAINERAMRLPAGTVKVVGSRLGYDAGVIGASALVLYEAQKKRKRP